MKRLYRIGEIKKHCEGKEVLHLGYVQHSQLWRKKVEEGTWLHGHIAQVADSLVGLDILKEEVSEIRELLGYAGIYGDVTQLHKIEHDNLYDVIVCGELIEHVSNPGYMLDGIKRFLKKNGILIITTPNPWRTLWVQKIRNNVCEDQWLNAEHVAWYSFQTLKQLLDRHGYVEVDYGYYWSEICDDDKHSLFLALKKWGAKLLGKIHDNRTSELESEGLFFVAKKDD